jgi:hypothetical protein
LGNSRPSGGDDLTARREWFQDQELALNALRETLTPWTGFKRIRWLWAPVSTIVILYLGGQHLWDSIFNADLPKLGVLAFLTIFPLVYLSFPVRQAFIYKRSVFTGDLSGERQEKDGVNESSIYRAEVQLWNALELARKPEPRIDDLLLAGPLFIFCVFEVIGGIIFLSWVYALVAGAFFAALGAGALLPNDRPA